VQLAALFAQRRRLDEGARQDTRFLVENPLISMTTGIKSCRFLPANMAEFNGKKMEDLRFLH
jgi:hypothetical protein